MCCSATVFTTEPHVLVQQLLISSYILYKMSFTKPQRTNMNPLIALIFVTVRAFLRLRNAPLCSAMTISLKINTTCCILYDNVNLVWEISLVEINQQRLIKWIFSFFHFYKAL